MSTYANDFGKDDGDGGLDAAVDDGTEAAESHEEPLGRVDGEHAPHRYRWNVRVLQPHSMHSRGLFHHCQTNGTIVVSDTQNVTCT